MSPAGFSRMPLGFPFFPFSAKINSTAVILIYFLYGAVTSLTRR